MMKCLNCQTENDEQNITCRTCGLSLHSARANLYLDRAEVSINSGRSDEASASMVMADREMLTLSSEQRSQYLLTARAFYLQGLIYYNRGALDQARAELLLVVRNLEARTDGAALLVKAFNVLGNASYYQGQIDEALTHYQRSSEIAISVGDHIGASRALGNEASMCIGQQAIEEALAIYNRSLDHARLSNDPLALAQSYRVLGWMHANYGSLQLARDYIAQSLNLVERLEVLDIRCLILSEAGNIYTKCGDLERAEDCLRKAEVLIHGTGNRLVEEGVEVNMAELMRQKGAVPTWYDYATRAFRDSDSSLFLRSEASLQLAYYYIKHQDWVRTRRHLRWLSDALNQTKDATGYDKATVDHIRALLYSGLGEWQESDKCFTLALASDALSYYELATVWEEYATMLLLWAATEASAATRTAAEKAVAEAAALFRQLDVPQRVTYVYALLTTSPPAALATPIKDCLLTQLTVFGSRAHVSAPLRVSPLVFRQSLILQPQLA